MGTQAFHLVVSLFDALIGHCADTFPDQVRRLIRVYLASHQYLQELSVVIHRSQSHPKNVTAYVTPVGEGKKPVQAIHMSMSSYMNGHRISRLLDSEPVEPQAC